VGRVRWNPPGRLATVNRCGQRPARLRSRPQPALREPPRRRTPAAGCAADAHRRGGAGHRSASARSRPTSAPTTPDRTRSAAGHRGTHPPRAARATSTCTSPTACTTARMSCAVDGQRRGLLLRAGEIVERHSRRARRRGRRRRTSTWPAGPARLAQALGIDRRFDGPTCSPGPLRLTCPARGARRGYRHRARASESAVPAGRRVPLAVLADRRTRRCRATGPQNPGCP
jgi:hypothetical protein